MTRSTDLLVCLRRALQDAVRAGKKDDVKRLTKLVVALMGGG
jgi:hypothetical protein